MNDQDISISFDSIKDMTIGEVLKLQEEAKEE